MRSLRIALVWSRASPMASTVTRPNWLRGQVDRVSVVELVELVLERGDFRFQFGDEGVGRRFLDLRDVFDFMGRLGVVTGFREDAVAHIERLEERDETLQFRESEDAWILLHIRGGNGRFDCDEVIDLLAQSRE